MTDEASAATTAVFEPDGARFVPTVAATGPWDRSVLHGAAVSALLAALLDHPEDEVTTRILVELLAPVPFRPLGAEIGATEGGRRVKRQCVVLSADDRPVARARALRIRRTNLALPEDATTHESVFSADDRPDLGAPNEVARRRLGWDSFDSVAMASCWDPIPSPSGRQRLWLQLLLPIVAERAPAPLDGVVAAADYGSGGTANRLHFRRWSYMNADLVVSLGRPPSPGWIGLECDGVLSRTGCGQSVATIYDVDGQLGQSSQSLLIEARDT